MIEDDDFVTQYVTNIDPPAEDEKPNASGLALIVIVGGAFVAMVVLSLIVAAL